MCSIAQKKLTEDEKNVKAANSARVQAEKENSAKVVAERAFRTVLWLNLQLQETFHPVSFFCNATHKLIAFVPLAKFLLSSLFNHQPS
jgi:hypothetical protein